MSINNKKYTCVCCDHICSYISDWNRHISTIKHKRLTNTNEPICENEAHESTHICSCGNVYKHMSSLCKHKKKCPHLSKNNVLNEPVIENTLVQEPPEPFDFSIMFELIKQNQEFKELLVEQNKHIIDLAGKIGTTNNTQNIKQQNNNQFNIQMFLNEKCKDAISLDDFVESLQFNTQTAEYAGKHGFVNGITNIFMTGLKQLEVHQRPFHCTDAKRETLYVKRIDMWAKDGETNPTMLDAINDVSTKNMRQMPRWIEENPECQHSGTDKFEEQLRIMHGMLNTQSNKEKVLKNLAKESLIDKNSESVIS
jgi:hypothetical protein